MKLPASFFAAGLLFAPAALAAPLPSSDRTDASPVFSVQAKSVDYLRDALKATGKNFFAGPLNERFEQEVLAVFDGKTLKGIDTKKPAGLYTVVSAGLLRGDLAKSSLVFLVPIADEKEFIALLAGIGLNFEKKGDYWSAPFPNSQLQANIWIQKGYAHIVIATEKPDPKTLLDPQGVINGKETAGLVIHLRADRLPDDFKAESLAVLAETAEQADTSFKERNKNRPNQIPKEAIDLVAGFFRISLRWVKLVSSEVKEVVVRCDLDPKTGLLIVEKTVEPKSGTELAKSFSGLKASKNDFADIVNADSAAHVLIQAPLFVDDARDLAAALVDFAIASADRALRNEPKELRELGKESLRTLNRTLKSGNLDFAASLRGPDKNDQYTAVGAISVKDTAALETALKAGLKAAPKDIAEKFKFDVFKVDAINVHEIAIADELPPEAQKIFGKSSVYFAFTANAAFASFGPQGKEAIKELITTKHTPKHAPLVSMEASGKRLAALIKSAGAPTEGLPGNFFQMLAKLDRTTFIKVKVEGGERLVVRTEFNLLYPFAALYFD